VRALLARVRLNATYIILFRLNATYIILFRFPVFLNFKTIRSGSRRSDLNASVAGALTSIFRLQPPNLQFGRIVSGPGHTHDVLP
jgi:hypothetical protein